MHQYALHCPLLNEEMRPQHRAVNKTCSPDLDKVNTFVAPIVLQYTYVLFIYFLFCENILIV